MATVTIKAPESSFEGSVAGVTFVKGVAKVDPSQHPSWPGALGYFQSAGYEVNGKVLNPPPGRYTHAAPARHAPVVELGTRARDAAEPESDEPTAAPPALADPVPATPPAGEPSQPPAAEPTPAASPAADAGPAPSGLDDGPPATPPAPQAATTRGRPASRQARSRRGRSGR